jgi:thiol:disulfide interchange protein DsbD
MPRLAPSLPDAAVGRALVEDDVPQLEARLLVSHQPDLQAGVLFTLAPGWHLYWRNPGDTGIAPRLEFEAAGYEMQPLVWPTPQRFEEANGLFTTYGYEGSVLLGGTLLSRGDVAPDAQLSVEVDALVCRTECVPAHFSLSTPLASALPGSEQARVDAAFAHARKQVPPGLDALGLEASAHWLTGAPGPNESRRLKLALHTCPVVPSHARPSATGACLQAPEPADAPLFIPIDAEHFELSNARLLPTEETDAFFALEIEAYRLSDEGMAAPEPPGSAANDRLHGLLGVRDDTGALRHVEIDLAIAAKPEREAGMAAAVSFGDWLQVGLLALLGGLILNGMPCVLPVLAIKAVAIADLAERDRSEIRVQGLAYTIGVLASMATLATVVIALRAAGHSVGWGFQFQEPLFVAAISAIVVAFALNLFGVYEIELGQGRLATLGQEGSSLQRSLFEGLLAVVLATPCTAPFLGTAVGFAFAGSAPVILFIFLAIGLGLAMPFLLVSFFPGLARLVPRSGPWMLQLRAGLGFCLLATAVWLLWVLGRSGGTGAVIATVSVLLGLAFVLWVFGQLQPLRSLWLGRASAFAILCLAVASFNLIELDRVEPAGADTHVPSTDVAGREHEWSPWSEEAVHGALAAGRPSFVVFTADWCLTCQVNEHTVLEREEIRQALAEGGYALFEADWSRRDEVIRRKLAEFGRAGVPLYLVYSPEAPTRPQILPELLTRKQVLAALERSERHPRI